MDASQSPNALVLHLEAYEGPLEVLLELAKTQKVDLAAISILALVDQYLAFVREVKRQNLELAADYLVMAAVLAYLKSQLLLPLPEVDALEIDPAETAALLALRLKKLQAMKDAGEALYDLPLLGQQRFATDRAPQASITRHIRHTANLFDLLSAYAGFKQREQAASLTMTAPRVYKFEEALARVQALLNVKTPGWIALQDFLPEQTGHGKQMRRSALASTLMAGLELTKQGKLDLRQDRAFGPLMLRTLDPAAHSP